MNEKRIFMMTLLLIILITPNIAAALPSYADEVPGLLNDLCIVCHEKPDGSGLNSYGKDFAAHNKSFEEIAKLDSDGDGYTNSEELNASTFPGDSQSYPGHEWSSGFSMLTAVVVLLGLWIIFKKK